MTAREQTREHSTTGSGSEFLAGQYFSDCGYRIVERNYRARRGEIDLVVEKDNEIAFVEVRYRKTARFGAPEETVTTAKRRKLSMAALEFITSRNTAEKSLRFDVLAMVRKGASIALTHFENAFEPEFDGVALQWS